MGLFFNSIMHEQLRIAVEKLCIRSRKRRQFNSSNEVYLQRLYNK